MPIERITTPKNEIEELKREALFTLFHLSQNYKVGHVFTVEQLEDMLNFRFEWGLEDLLFDNQYIKFKKENGNYVVTEIPESKLIEGDLEIYKQLVEKIKAPDGLRGIIAYKDIKILLKECGLKEKEVKLILLKIIKQLRTDNILKVVWAGRRWFYSIDID